ARGYANLDTLRDVHFEPGSRTLSARVQGTGSRAYRTEVTFGQRAAEGWSRPKLSTCTCPVGLRCKHAAALMLYAGSTPPRSAGRQPDWRRQLEQAVTGLRSGGPSPDGETYGLQLSMVPDENIRDGWEGGLRPGLGTRLRGRIVALARSRRQARVWLDLCDAEVPALWPLIATAAEAEIEIVPGDGLLDVLPGPPRRVGLTAWSPDERDVVVTAAAEIRPDGDAGEEDDDEGERPLPGALVGAHGDLVAVIRDRVLELSPVGRLDPDVARNLREWASLTIPDEAVPEFCGDFLPGLAEVFPV